MPVTGKSEIDIIILGSLLRGPAHGYELKRRVEASFSQFYLGLSPGSLYSRLQKFEKEGLVAGRREPQEGVPDRTVYQLTGPGKSRLRELVATPVGSSGRMWSDQESLIVRVIFFDLITKAERRRVVGPFHEAALEQLQEARDAIEQYGGSIRGFTMEALTHGAEVLASNLAFYERIMEMD